MLKRTFDTRAFGVQDGGIVHPYKVSEKEIFNIYLEAFEEKLLAIEHLVEAIQESLDPEIDALQKRYPYDGSDGTPMDAYLETQNLALMAGYQAGLVEINHLYGMLGNSLDKAELRKLSDVLDGVLEGVEAIAGNDWMTRQLCGPDKERYQTGYC